MSCTSKCRILSTRRAGLAHHRKRLGQQVIQYLGLFVLQTLFGHTVQFLGDAGAKFLRLGGQLLVRQRLDGGFEGV